VGFSWKNQWWTFGCMGSHLIQFRNF
jgi:hypothetical protein